MEEDLEDHQEVAGDAEGDSRVRGGLPKRGAFNERDGSGEVQMGAVGCALVRDEPGEMGKRQFCGESYFLCNGVTESSRGHWEPRTRGT